MYKGLSKYIASPVPYAQFYEPVTYFMYPFLVNQVETITIPTMTHALVIHSYTHQW